MSPVTFERLRREWLTWDGFLALGAGSGLSPWAPGTMGTLVAIPVVMLMSLAGDWGYALLTLLGFCLGVLVCDRVGKRLGASDHGAIVWDEVIGYALTVSLVPKTGFWLAAGFVVFRVFDILKPWPIRQIEKRVPGGFGVMIDDVLAAVYSMLALYAVQLLLAGA